MNDTEPMTDEQTQEQIEAKEHTGRQEQTSTESIN